MKLKAYKRIKSINQAKIVNIKKLFSKQIKDLITGIHHWAVIKFMRRVTLVG